MLALPVLLGIFHVAFLNAEITTSLVAVAVGVASLALRAMLGLFLGVCLRKTSHAVTLVLSISIAGILPGLLGIMSGGSTGQLPGLLLVFFSPSAQAVLLPVWSSLENRHPARDLPLDPLCRFSLYFTLLSAVICLVLYWRIRRRTGPTEAVTPAVSETAAYSA
jgi:hypothetical protein